MGIPADLEPRKKYHSKIIEDAFKDIPLSTRIRVGIQAYFVDKNKGSFFMPVDEECKEYKEISKINAMAYAEAQPIIDLVEQIIEDFKKEHG